MFIETLLLTVALTAQAPAPALPPTAALAEAYNLFLQGQSSEDGGDLGTAIGHYRKALDLVPDAAGIRAELAGLYAQQGDLPRARQEAERALVTEPGNRSAHRLLGLLEFSSLERMTAPAPNDPVVLAAIGHLERSTADGGVRDPGVVLTLGDLYVRAARYDRAIVVLQQFLLDRPGYPQAMMLLAQAYRGAGQPDRAEELVRAMRSGDPESVTGRLRALEALESQGEWAKAAAGWSALLEEQPAQVAYRLRYATALVNSGETDSGRSELEAITRAEPADVRAWYLLAQVEGRAGRSEAAESAARRIVEIDPADARGPIALAMVFAQRNDYRNVIAALQPRVDSPTESDLATGMFSQMATLLSEAWVDLGQPRQGIRTLESARKRAPADQQLLFTLAATYERDDQADRAEQAFREIIQADPEHAAALNYLGYMLADRGRKLPEALTLIERAIAVAGENPAYLDSLGWAYYRLARFYEAVGPLERAAKGAPEASVIHDHLGDAYVKVGRHAEAAEAFDRALSGDRDGIDERAITRKRDRARASAQRE